MMTNNLIPTLLILLTTATVSYSCHSQVVTNDNYIRKEVNKNDSILFEYLSNKPKERISFFKNYFEENDYMDKRLFLYIKADIHSLFHIELFDPKIFSIGTDGVFYIKDKSLFNELINRLLGAKIQESSD